MSPYIIVNPFDDPERHSQKYVKPINTRIHFPKKIEHERFRVNECLFIVIRHLSQILELFGLSLTQIVMIFKIHGF